MSEHSEDNPERSEDNPEHSEDNPEHSEDNPAGLFVFATLCGFESLINPPKPPDYGLGSTKFSTQNPFNYHQNMQQMHFG
jgi:hypothetical protein